MAWYDLSCCSMVWYVMLCRVVSGCIMLYYDASCCLRLCYVMLWCVMLVCVVLWAVRTDFLYVFRKSSRLHEKTLVPLHTFRLTERFYEVSLSTFVPSTLSQKVDAFWSIFKQVWCKFETHVEALSKQFQGNVWRALWSKSGIILKFFRCHAWRNVKELWSNIKANLEANLRYFWSELKAKSNFWTVLKQFWSILKHFEAFLKHFEAFWSNLEAFWSKFEAFWSILKISKQFWSNFEAIRNILKHF